MEEAEQVSASAYSRIYTILIQPGNINSKAGAQVNAADLETPTIKSNMYTTGRGGSGNMAKSNAADPAESRKAQDVDTPAHHNKDMQGTYHWGRGGEGNMTTLGKSGAQQAREKSQDRQARKKMERTLSSESAQNGQKRTGSFSGVLNKGKEMLGLKGKQDPKNESAIE